MTAQADQAGSYGALRECLIAHDRADVVQAVSVHLRQHGISVIWTAHNGSEVVEAIVAHTPALALLDLAGSEGLDVDVVRATLEASPATHVVVYVASGGSVVLEALDAGARGVLRRNASIAELGRAIDAVMGGGVYVDGVLARSLTAGEASRPLVMLTTREREVLALLANGLTYAQVGERLKLRPGTVETHVKNATRRLGAKSRTEAVAIAIRLSLIE